jgi:hypothetical protein
MQMLMIMYLNSLIHEKKSERFEIVHKIKNTNDFQKIFLESEYYRA